MGPVAIIFIVITGVDGTTTVKLSNVEGKSMGKHANEYRKEISI